MRGRLLARRAEALAWLFRTSEVGGPAREALALLPTGSDAWLRALGELSEAVLGDAALLAVGVDALAMLPHALRSIPAAVVAAARTAQAAASIGQLELAERLLAGEAVASSVDDAALGWIARARATVVAARGNTAAAVPRAEAAAAHFRRAGDERQAVLDEIIGGTFVLELGRLDDARRTLAAGLLAADRLGAATMVTGARQSLGLALVLLERGHEAETPLREALAAYALAGFSRGVALCRVYVARAALARHQPDVARVELELVLGDSACPPDVDAYARALRAIVRCALGDPHAALADAEHAHAFALAHDVEEGEALIRLAYVEALDAVGRAAEAKVAVDAAVARLHARAAPLDEVARRTFLEAFPEHRRTVARSRASG